MRRTMLIFSTGPLATAAAAAATASTSAAATRKPVGVVGQQADQSTGAASAKLRLGIKRPSSTGVAAESPSEPKQARKGKSNDVLNYLVFRKFPEVLWCACSYLVVI